MTIAKGPLICEQVRESFPRYLKRTIKDNDYQALKMHLDTCKGCWTYWNTWRWERARSQVLINDLKDFLGKDFRDGFDSSWALANEWTTEDRTKAENVEAFYEKTENYLYNLAVWEASGNRPDYVSMAKSILFTQCSKIILDFGCGIGNDSIKLLKCGFEVILFDLSKISLSFAKYRLDKAGLKKYHIVDNYNDLSSLNFDTVWAMDVIEHLLDPQKYLQPLLRQARTLIYDTDHAGTSEGRQPFHYDHNPHIIFNILIQSGFTKLDIKTQLNVYQKN